MERLLASVIVAVLFAGASYAQTSTEGETLTAEEAEEVKAEERRAREQERLKAEERMLSLTLNVVAGISGNNPEPDNAGDSQNNSLESLVKQAVENGESDAYLEALISEAVNDGRVEVPPAMRTTDGEVDTRTLLSEIVAKADEGGTDASVAPLEEEAQEVRKDQYYDVKPGDSLAAISREYYGSVQGYLKIFNANRNILSSPDQIEIGQRLLIPG